MTDRSDQPTPPLETLAQAAARLSDEQLSTQGTAGPPSDPAPEAPAESPADSAPSGPAQSDAAPEAPAESPSESAPEAKGTSQQQPDAASAPGASAQSGERSPAQRPAGEEPRRGGGERTTMISEPGKLVRVGTMAQQLLEEVRRTDLDDRGRERLAEIHRRTIDELAVGMSDELIEELKRLDLPFGEADTPTIGELRIAQAQLVGWLEGLFHGIQSAIMSQQAAQQAAQQQPGALPRGAVIMSQEDAQSAGADSEQDSAHRPGNYL